MELIQNHNPQDMLADTSEVISNANSNFIEANTKEVSLPHLKNDCIIPVFAKDNESTISHHEFIQTTKSALNTFLGNDVNTNTSVRVSHQIKGRIPSAIGKPVKELREDEKTLYYERMAFVIQVPHIQRKINGQKLSLCVGGVRGYNQENLYSKKSLEKFKVFIGFQNSVCTNLCISTDGFSNKFRVSTVQELENQILDLFQSYQMSEHLEVLESFLNIDISEDSFAQLIGKMKMYPYLTKKEKESVFPIQLNDTHINNISKMYFVDEHFKRLDGKISLWNLYNLFTGAIKSSYIDVSLERNQNVYEFIRKLAFSTQNGSHTFYLPN